MKANPARKTKGQDAYALALVMVIGAISIALFTSIAMWTHNSSALNYRNNTYNSAAAAAEGATEIVLSYMSQDFDNQTFNAANLSFYRTLVPTNDWAAKYQFSDGAGGLNQTFVSSSSTMVLTNLTDQFAGLYGLAYLCTVRSAATPLNTPYSIAAAVQQDLQLATIPVFQFAIFYGMDMEINPGAAMKVTGKVHSNQSLYTSPGATLEFVDTVTAVSNVNKFRLDGGGTPTGTIKYDLPNQPTPHASSLTLPTGTDNSPTSVRAILDPPPFGEVPQSPVGQQRYYNKADLVITITSTGEFVTTGEWDGFQSVPADTLTNGYSFIKTNLTFYDSRELKTNILTDINVGQLNNWMTYSNASLNSKVQTTLGHNINSIYVQDQRTGVKKLTAVRVSSGQQLPPDGLTVATPQPLYVQGHYNAPITTVGSTNTSGTMPASFLADSITVLSSSWADTNSANISKNFSKPTAGNTTVNAAFLAGIVQTTNTSSNSKSPVWQYSGGVENFPRFLENWGSSTLTYNGSMVVLFPSKYATNWWVGPGTASTNYYVAPTRSWAFDVNFLNAKKLPPATPQVRQLIRGKWTTVAGK